MDFNVRRESPNVQQVWVTLPRFSMVFWKEGILVSIGNKFGRFNSLEDDQESKIDRQCAFILVEIDIRDGLFEEILS